MDLDRRDRRRGVGLFSLSARPPPIAVTENVAAGLAIMVTSKVYGVPTDPSGGEPAEMRASTSTLMTDTVSITETVSSSELAT